jgi:hypothetical protein
MANLEYVRAENIELKSSADYNEMWLQNRIAEDPSLIGLGDLIVIDRERRQERAGRLDLLLSDADNKRRYEVELMLGATDESHLIRTIEYWDIERRRYPAYDHTAVLIAEDITSRFLNVIGLFAGNIPIVAIQVNALRVGEQIALNFTRVIDQKSLRTDDETTPAPVGADRDYWATRVPTKIIDLADSVLGMINAGAATTYKLNFNRQYAGLHNGKRPANFTVFRFTKRALKIVIKTSTPDECAAALDEVGVLSMPSPAGIEFNISELDNEEIRRAISTVMLSARNEYEN